MSNVPIGFFAYPSRPGTIPEAMNAAIEAINRGAQIRVNSWEDCRVSGKLIIDEICRSIQLADIFLADLTGINPNVMFELGYAIGRGKRTWLVLDTTLADSKREYDQLELLTTVGYAPYRNWTDVVHKFLQEQPHLDLGSSIFTTSIQPSLYPGDRRVLLYLKTRHDTTPSRRLDGCIETLEQAGVPCVIDDPSESRVQALSWYAQKIYAALGVLVHLAGAKREGARMHNARYAFVAGLAHGLEKPLLMLVEDDYEAPIDYRHLLRRYSTGRQCVEEAEPWLQMVERIHLQQQVQVTPHLATMELATELRSFRFGEHLAENEQEALNDYFVETSSYDEALNGRHTIFAGRKGSGKTANLLRIASVLRGDKRNLVCVVKPVGYEVDALVRLLKRYEERDTKGYLVESLWKFLIYTEVAKTTADWIADKRGGCSPGSDEDRLLDLRSRQNGLLSEDFSIRLERCVDALCRLDAGDKIEASRVAISEALHEGVLRDLRGLLGRILSTRQRVAVLVDNLDKGWDKRGDLPLLADLLLGLLSAARRVPADFAKRDAWRQSVNLTLTVFLRSDIFDNVMRVAREPDKISYSRLYWKDRDLLLRVLEERFVASHGGRVPAEDLWSKFFCESVRGQPTREYLSDRILPRPRDIVFIANAAVAIAVNRRHTRVEEEDVLEAEKQYSQYALDTIQVENGITLPVMEAVVFEFAGMPQVLSHDQVCGILRAAGITPDGYEMVIGHLVRVSFLGPEVRENEFVFSEDEEEQRKNAVLARRLFEERGRPRRYEINAPFHSFLEIAPT